MFRSINPKAQVTLVETYVTEQGGTPKRSKTHEVVAKLNGAPNWNVLSGTAQKQEESVIAELCRKAGIPAALIPGFEALYAESGAKATCPAEQASTFGWVMGDLPKQLWALNNQVRKLHGDNREKDVPADWTLITLTDLLNSDDWSDAEIELGNKLATIYGSESDIDDVMARIVADGVGIDATVRYPDGSEYGVPEEATDDGGRDFFWGLGFALKPTFDVYGEDTGDDRGASYSLTLAIPPALYEELKAFIAG